MRRWAWKLPHEYRFGLWCVHSRPRGHKERLEAAAWLRKWRRS